jgi:hypothetical protein
VDLAELKVRWEAMDAKLDAVIRLDRGIVAGRALDRVDALLARHARARAAEAVAGLLAVWLTGSFVAANAGEPRFLLPGLALHACVLLQIALVVRQALESRRIDYGAPLVEIQRRLGALRVASIRQTLWTFLAAPLLWTPLLIVGLRGVFGVDAYAVLGAKYLLANLALGVAVIAGGFFLARRYTGGGADTAVMPPVLAALAGTSLAAATASLESLARFERDEEA